MKNLSLLIFLLETFDKHPVFYGIHFISCLDLVTVIITSLALLEVMLFQVKIVFLIFGHYRVVVCAVERSFWYSVVCWFITKRKQPSWKILTIVDNVYRGFIYRCSDNRERAIKVNPLQRNSSSKNAKVNIRKSWGLNIAKKKRAKTRRTGTLCFIL